MNIKNDYPKAWEAYKAYLLDKYGGDKRIAEFITDETLELSLKSTPMSGTAFLDSIGFVGAVCYNGLEERFVISLNGEAVEDVDFEHNEDLPFIGSSDRKEAEITLIKYLFSEVEKTL